LGWYPLDQEAREDLLLGVVLAGRGIDEPALADREVVGGLALEERDLHQIERARRRAILLGPGLADQLLDVTVLERLTGEVALELARGQQQIAEQLGVGQLVELLAPRIVEQIGERDG